MATSCLVGSSEKNNGIKLSRLLIDGGTSALRSAFNKHHPPDNLAISLLGHKPRLQHLLDKKVIHQAQWDKLFPPSGAAPDSKTFDITLLFALLRNICPATVPITGWDVLPNITDNSQEAHFVRVKFYRNKVYGHISSTELSNAEFEQYWGDISTSLIALGIDQNEIDLLKTSPVGETEYFKQLEEWVTSEESLRETLLRESSKIHVDLKKIEEITKQTNESVEHLKETIQDAFKTHGKRNIEIQKLNKCDFRSYIESLVELYDPTTRTWILDDINKFVRNKESRVVLLTTLPGVGKSVLAAVTCNMLREDQLAACHFVQHGNCLRNKPRLILESLASQLCGTIPGYSVHLEERLFRILGDELDNMNCEELITVLLEEPLAAIQNPEERSFVIVIDALDEIDSKERNEFKSSLFNKVSALPKWIKLIATTRQSRELETVSTAHTVLNINPTSRDNMDDIERYLHRKLEPLYPEYEEAEINKAATCLASSCEGSFLFAHFATGFIAKEHIAINQVSSVFPIQLSAVYEQYFERIEKELNVNEIHFDNFLRALVASKTPLPETIVLKILGFDTKSDKKKNEAGKILKQLSVLFPMEERCVRVFHKSVNEWLTQNDELCTGAHRFRMNIVDGHRVLAEQCFDILQGIQNHTEEFPPPLANEEIYALQFGWHHMLEARECEEQLRKLVLDLEVVSAKCSTLRYVRDLLEELKEVRQVLDNSPEELDRLIKNLELDKYVLTDPKSCPQIVLQAAVDGPECEMRNKAIQLLKTSKYRHLPWIDETSSDWNITGVIWDIAVSTRRKVAVCWGKPTDRNKKGCLGCLTTFHTDGSSICSISYRSSTFYRSPRAISLSYDGKLVLVATLQPILELRNVSYLEIQMTFRSDGNALKCCFIPNSSKVVAGCFDGKVRIWDKNSKDVESVLEGHTACVTLCSSSCDGRFMTGDNEGYLILWKGTTKVCTVTKEWSATDGSAIFSPDGKLLAAVCRIESGAGSVVKLFSSFSGTLLSRFQKDAFGPLTFVDDDHVLGKCHGIELGMSHGRVFVVNVAEKTRSDPKTQYLPCSYCWLNSPHHLSSPQQIDAMCIDAVRLNSSISSLTKFNICNLK